MDQQQILEISGALGGVADSAAGGATGGRLLCCIPPGTTDKRRRWVTFVPGAPDAELGWYGKAMPFSLRLFPAN